MADSPNENQDDLDAFFQAAEVDDPRAIRRAARNVVESDTGQHKDVASAPSPQANYQPATDTGLLKKLAQAVNEASNDDITILDDDEEVDEMLRNDDLEGKFIAIDPSAFPGGADDPDQPFVLIPANIHHYLPWWGWLTIVLGLMILVAGVVMMPAINLSRLVSRLDDKNEANVRHAMRQLVMKGDERTVKKLYGMATSDKAGITTRLRAVDTMSLIERVPEVDRALLRLELSASTNKQVREAAIAARKQREAYKTRGRGQ